MMDFFLSHFSCLLFNRMEIVSFRKGGGGGRRSKGLLNFLMPFGCLYGVQVPEAAFVPHLSSCLVVSAVLGHNLNRHCFE